MPLRRAQLDPAFLIDTTVSGSCLVLLNVVLCLNILCVKTSDDKNKNISDLYGFFIPIHEITFATISTWLTANTLLLFALFLIRRHIFYPMVGIVKQLYGMFGALSQEAPQHGSIVSMRTIAGDINRMAQLAHELAHEYYTKHQDTSYALKQARSVISQIVAQQEVIVATTSREMQTQYQSVLAYANYLEEQISRHAVDPSLRYDFDEVSESSFNLKLIAGALNLIENHAQPQCASISIPELLQQTMLALAPSLDRRSMKLTTVEVDLAVMAFSDPAIIAHVLWMLLLGTIRYAADESTLRLRCLYNRERTRALISIVVTELSPGRLSEDERGAFLSKQLQHLTPHMFAETIRIHANMQLAEMLMAALDGSISTLPLTSHSCEICLTLPVASEPPAA